MKTVSLKMADNILEEIDTHLESHHFTTRTEFIREAIRDKLKELETRKFERDVRKYFHENKAALAREMGAIGSDVFKELENRFG